MDPCWPQADEPKQIKTLDQNQNNLDKNHKKKKKLRRRIEGRDPNLIFNLVLLWFLKGNIVFREPRLSLPILKQYEPDLPPKHINRKLRRQGFRKSNRWDRSDCNSNRKWRKSCKKLPFFPRNEDERETYNSPDLILFILKFIYWALFLQINPSINYNEKCRPLLLLVL